ncbi:hypothetical protein psyc5s11_27720 [Clostridium gelidum]|uniref:Uncharacterized protein n=1 Tax=Clostridium gelidum TaxID=704125 RepID=A0ABM7T423_9CLOT|nr:hypothetical protein [Clostridium gelidum]BCZ46705.1 hypothetical protein psyc5s11_27720 [Clostridium gelidum]
MKRFSIIFLLILFLLPNMTIATSHAQQITLKEGDYRASDLNLLPNNNYSVENISTSDSAVVIIFDSNSIIQELIKLVPESGTYNLPIINHGYEIMVIGNGEVIIS